MRMAFVTATAAFAALVLLSGLSQAQNNSCSNLCNDCANIQCIDFCASSCTGTCAARFHKAERACRAACNTCMHGTKQKK
jgi:hypothetical protein